MTREQAKAHFERVLLLSPREYQTLILSGKGLSTPQIAARIGCCNKTIWTYVERIREVFDLPTYRQVIVLGARFLASGLKREPLMPEDARYKWKEIPLVDTSDGQVKFEHSPYNGRGLKRLEQKYPKGIP